MTQLIIVVLRKRAKRRRTKMRDELAELGVAPEHMIAAGLLTVGRKVAVPYDRFKGRVVVRNV